jgi:hypothetical protein
MILISHRGNTNGPSILNENSPNYIDKTISLGYEVEVDLRIHNNEFWLGHDYPQYRVDLLWMQQRNQNIWFHCKDKDSVLRLLNLNLKFKFFCHQNDDFTLTSTGHLWVHNTEGILNKNCIVPLITESEVLKYNKMDIFGICTDFVELL